MVNAITSTGKRKHSALRKEASGRRFDVAIGGVTGEKIPTAYREQAIQVLCALALVEQHSPAGLRADFGCSERTPTILSGNPYGWFYRIERGIYGVSPQGLLFLEEGEFPSIVDFYRKDAAAKQNEHQKENPSC